MKTYEILIWLALVLLAIGGWLVAPALAFFIVGAGLLALGLALSREAENTPYEAPEGIDALNTASPEPAESDT